MDVFPVKVIHIKNIVWVVWIKITFKYVNYKKGSWYITSRVTHKKSHILLFKTVKNLNKRNKKMKVKISSNKNKVIIILGFNLHRHGHLASSYNDDCRFAASTLLSTCLCFFLLWFSVCLDLCCYQFQRGKKTCRR